MLAMQDKSGLIQEQSITSADIRRVTAISQREELNLLPTNTQIIVPNIEILPSQMTKSQQATMVNEAATCSSTTTSNVVDTINSNTNTNSTNSMSTPSMNEQNQLSIRSQSQHTNNSHTSGTNSNNPSMASTPTSATTNNTSIGGSNARTARRTANDYRFGKTIGEGSFSSVYIAQDIHTKKEVASKC